MSLFFVFSFLISETRFPPTQCVTIVLHACPFSTCVTPAISRHTHLEGELYRVKLAEGYVRQGGLVFSGRRVRSKNTKRKTPREISPYPNTLRNPQHPGDGGHRETE